MESRARRNLMVSFRRLAALTYEENEEDNRVIRRTHVQVLLHASRVGVSDVRPIQV